MTDSSDAFELKRNVILPLAITVVLIFIALQLQGLSLEPHVSETYVSFYGGLVAIGLAGIVGMAFFQIKFGFKLMKSRKWKLAILTVFVLFIVFLSLDRGQIIPVPRASVQEFQLNSGTELYTSSVIPGIVEDLVYLWLLPLAIIITILGLYEWKIGEAGKPQIIAAVVIGCLIASTGYNIWLIPGFTSAHIPAYGQSDAYFGAWIFSFGQSMVYMTTGVFMPAAHIIHNLIISYGELYQINTAGFLIVGG